MRSLLMVGALCAVVMMFTGCHSCNRLSGGLLGQRHLGETCSGGCSAGDTIVSGDCGCSDCAAGLSAQRLSQGRQASLQNRLARSESRSSSGALDRLATRRSAIGTSEPIFDGGIRPVGGRVLGGRVAHAGGALAACGAGGCGLGAKGCRSCGLLGAKGCRSCGVRDRLAGLGHGGAGLIGGQHTKPYGGTIPHTDAPPTFNGGPGGGGVPQYVYPYYTTRGPRDFLNTNPPSIGP